ncbi:MAG TPA: pyridoxamine 5'-phosphate oxidase family protein [Stellaceae bacterium]|nr:pyridoxamine 5'-phosphate oxidase family protein [Stellaceae bacterium]
MSQQTELVAQFLSSLKSGAAADLLAQDAGFQALNVDLKGRDAVLARFAASAAAYGDAGWTQEDKGDAVQAVGTLPNGARLILTVQVKGGKIALLQQQMLPGAPRLPAALRLPSDLKARIGNALKERHPIVISYVDEAGQPNVTFRGSTQAFSDTQLAIWVRNADGKMLRSIRKNPKVALMYRDEDSKATYNFQGRARIDDSDAARRQIYDAMAQVERDHDFARLGVALIIDLDLVEGYAGLSPNGPVNPIRMARAT